MRGIITSVTEHHVTMLTREAVARAYNTLLDADINFLTITRDQVREHPILRIIRWVQIGIGTSAVLLFVGGRLSLFDWTDVRCVLNVMSVFVWLRACDVM